MSDDYCVHCHTMNIALGTFMLPYCIKCVNERMKPLQDTGDPWSIKHEPKGTDTVAETGGEEPKEDGNG
jgi:hypothetical protein